MNRTEYTTHKGFVVGFDVGQSQDFSAITVIERKAHVVEDEIHGTSRTNYLNLRHLHRLPLGTSYPQQAEILCRLIGTLESMTTVGVPRPVLVLDATGVGRPVVDMVRKAGLRPCAVTISGGVNESRSGDFRFTIPKRNLVSALLIAFQSERLKIPKELPSADILLQELLNFRVKISDSGHDSYDAWRESVHDDLVLSCALACWYCERGITQSRQFSTDWMSR